MRVDAGGGLTGEIGDNVDEQHRIVFTAPPPLTASFVYPSCSSNFNKTLLLSLGEHTCLVKTPENLSVVRGMCYIVPIQHKASFVEADGEVWDEVTRFKTSLTAMWAKQGREVVFCETVLQSSGSGLYQTKIECIPVKKGEKLECPVYITTFFLLTCVPHIASLTLSLAAQDRNFRSPSTWELGSR